MRVTSNSVVRDLVANLQQTYRRMDVLQSQLATGARVQRPSDDPTATRESMNLRSVLTANDRYQRNTDDGLAWVQAADSAFDQLSQILIRAKELSLSAANSPLPDQSREAIYDEARELLNQAVQVGNSSHGTRFIFNGFNASSPNKPFSLSTGTDPITGAAVTTVNGPSDAGQYITREVADGVRVSVNTPGSTLQPMIQKLADLVDVLGRVATSPTANPPPPAPQYETDLASLSSTFPAALETSLDQVLSLRADNGARMSRLETTQSQLMASQVNLEGLLSKTEDTDVVQAIMDLQMAQSAHQTTLAVGARIIPQTLVDFLR